MRQLFTFSGCRAVYLSGCKETTKPVVGSLFIDGLFLVLYLSFLIIYSSPVRAEVPALLGKVDLPKTGLVNRMEAGSTFACPTLAFTVPSAATISQCTNTTLNLSVSTTAKTPDAIKFVYFTSPLPSPADAYTATGGTVLGTVVSGTATTNTVSFTTIVPPNTTTGTLTVYVYALLQTTDITCKPVDSFVLNIRPASIAVIGGSATVCQGTSAALTLPPGLSYKWSTGATTRQISPVISATTTSAVYSATLTSVDGCVSAPARFTVTGVPCATCAVGTGRIGGTVYNDFDANGTQLTSEPGLAGIQVTIYACDASGNSISAGTTTTDFAGNYLFSGLTDGVTYRVEFGNVPGQFAQSARESQSGTSVQFVKSPSCGISLGLTDPTGYCQANAPVAVVCFARNSDAATETTILTANYDDGIAFNPANATDNNNNWSTPVGTFPLAAHATVGTVGTVGTTLGVAWDKTHKQLLSGAYMRAYAPMKTNAGGFGEGIIYKMDYASGSATTPTTWLDLETVLSPGVSGTFVADNPFPGSRTYGFTNSNPAKIGYTGLGSMRMSADNSELYVVNLNKLEVLVIPVDGTGAPVAAQLKRFPLPTGGCPTGNWSDGRPYMAALGLGVHPVTKRVYATVTCTGPTKADLKGLIYSVDPADASPAATDFRLETSILLNITMPANNPNQITWYDQIIHAWEVVTPNTTFYPTTAVGTQSSHTNPWLGEIEFDRQSNGTYGMLVATRNRFHDILSSAPAVTGGMLQRLANTGSDVAPSWVLESNAVVGDRVSTVNWTLNGATNAGGNTDLTNRFFKYVGREGAMLAGMLDYLPGRSEIILPAMDNVYNNATSGITWLNRNTGERSRDLRLLGDYSLNGFDATNFTKSNNWGGIVVLCNEAPIQIGNRVWRDDNQNGIQDPCEPPIPGAVVKLYDAAKTTVIASATTNAAGEYYFSSTTITAGGSSSSVSTSALQYNTTYSLVITSLGTNTVVTSQGLSLTDVSPVTPGESGALNSGNTLANNDATLDLVNGIGSPCIKLTTGGPGENNHTYDFGITKFVCSLSVTAAPSSTMICANSSATLTVGCQTGTPLWSTGATSLSISVTPASTTTYSVVCRSGSCVSPAASATVTVLPQPGVGGDQTLVCTNGVMPSSATLTAQTNSPVQTGQWYAQPGNPSATTFANATSLTTTVSGLLPGQTYRFVWANTTGCANGMVVTVGTCGTSPATYRLTKTANLNRVARGGIVTYTLSLTNTGNTTGTNIPVTDLFSTTAITFIGSATASAGTFTPTGNGGTWLIDALAPGQAASLVMRVQLNAEGITYNTATAPNAQTATVCATVPFLVCANESFQFILTAANGQASYQWSRNGQPITGATSSTLSATEVGEYSVAGGCPDGSCCPFIIEASPAPSLTAVATAATCTGATPLNNATISLVGSSTNAVSYNITMGSSFTANAPLFTTNQSLATVAGGLLKGGLVNPATAPGQVYTIRVFTADGCYTDSQVTVLPAQCNCASVCVPLQVTRRR